VASSYIELKKRYHASAIVLTSLSIQHQTHWLASTTSQRKNQRRNCLRLSASAQDSCGKVERWRFAGRRGSKSPTRNDGLARTLGYLCRTCSCMLLSSAPQSCWQMPRQPSENTQTLACSSHPLTGICLFFPPPLPPKTWTDQVMDGEAESVMPKLRIWWVHAETSRPVI